jgi:uncharacterized protein (TIGR00369 family)
VSADSPRRRWAGRTPATITNNPCFACGPRNPRGLHLDIQHDGESIYVDFTPDETWQGFGGLAHGGLVATVLDEVMAWALYGYDDLAVTAKMEITYRKPVPIGRPLRATARLREDRGRAKKVRGEIRDAAGRLLASAESLFLIVPKARATAMGVDFGTGDGPLS